MLVSVFGRVISVNELHSKNARDFIETIFSPKYIVFKPVHENASSSITVKLLEIVALCNE